MGKIQKTRSEGMNQNSWIAKKCICDRWSAIGFFLRGQSLLTYMALMLEPADFAGIRTKK